MKSEFSRMVKLPKPTASRMANGKRLEMLSILQEDSSHPRSMREIVCLRLESMIISLMWTWETES